MEPFGRFRVQFEKGATRFMLSIFGRACAPLFDYGNAHPRRKLAYGRREIDVFIIHQKAKGSAADPAAKTVKCLALRTNMKGRRLFLMKGAERFEARARAPKRKIRADHLDDVIGSGDLLDGLCWDYGHGKIDFSLV